MAEQLSWRHTNSDYQECLMTVRYTLHTIQKQKNHR